MRCSVPATWTAACSARCSMACPMRTARKKTVASWPISSANAAPPMHEETKMTEPLKPGVARLADRVAIVAGAAQGIGARYAQGLAGEGAAVVCADVVDSQATVAAITAAGGRALA